jgi:hypothetical protein
MNPADFLKTTMNYEAELKKAKSMSVDVGLLANKTGTYGDGVSALEVGTYHEYGTGKIPQRSFIRTPFLLKRKEMQERIGKEFEKVLQQQSTAETALGRVGVAATNISKGAFTTKGYGTWPDIAQATKDAKGSSQVLIDTGVLRNSIHWRVN